MKNITFTILLTLLVLAIVWVFISTSGNANEYNAHSCAVTGYQPDCKTPLEK